MQRALLLLCLAALSSACSGVWQPRSIPACYVPTGAPALDQERSYYALLIALSERKYVIVHAEAPRQIEVEYHSSYKPAQAYVHWLVDIAADASIHVQSIPEQASVSRKTLARQEQWFEMLSASTHRYSCRDVNWLRWEAQNRGLVPMAAEVPAELGEHDSGGAVPVQPLGAVAPSPAEAAPTRVDPDDPERRARVGELMRERSEISLVGPIAMTATGVGLLGGAIALAELALFDSDPDCDSAFGSGGDDTSSCMSPKLRRNLGIGAGALALGAAALIATGTTLLVRRLGRMKTISRELRGLREPALALGVDVTFGTASAGRSAPGLSVSLRASF